MAAYTAGELLALNYVNEATYGTTPTGALSFACRIQSLKPTTDLKNAYLIAGSRSSFYLSRGPYEVGFNLKGICHLLSGVSWRDFFATYALGSTTGTAEHLGSFTASVHKLVGANHYYNIYNGSKINRLTIDLQGPGMPAIFDADIFSQWVTPSTAKAITGLQSVTVGADATDLTTAICTWAGVCQINIAGGGANNFYPKSLKLTVNNNLERMPGNKVGADTNKYPVCAGITEGIREITAELELWYDSESLFNAMVNNSIITALTIPLDTYTITLANGYCETSEWPEVKQDIMSQTVRIRFPTITIA